MPEAEDVLIEAAERATRAVRAVWARNAGTQGASDERENGRRLALWLTACFGRSWPLTPIDAPRAPGWAGRLLRSPAPWQREPLAVASTDGTRILLPRAELARSKPGGATGVLLATLTLGQRLANGRLAALPRLPGAARDLAWALEGALAETALVRDLPGLQGDFAAARARALAARPALSQLREAERAVEERVRALLAEPSRGIGSGSPAADPTPAAVAAEAEAFAARFGPREHARWRGTAPVSHWGAAPGVAPAWLPASAPSSAARRGLPSRRLPRRVARRREETRDERGGPFVIPFSDPHLSVDDPAGVGRPPDTGKEDLDALAEELAGLDELGVVRSEAPVAELLLGEDEPRSSGAAPAALGEGAGATLWLYPEWDARTGAYRVPGCRVREVTLPALDGSWAARVLKERRALLERLGRHFEALRPRRMRVTRQVDGDDLDLASWVEEWAELRAGRTPAGRLYSRERHRRREVAVALLIDASGSTDAWVSGRQRVIDVARETALCFCEALATLGDRHAVYAFSGTGAADVRVSAVRRFEERGVHGVRSRIAGLEPDAFTRLGAPLRHVTAQLARQRARVRLLLLLSDGKPDDEDLYEGDYGVEDVRQAVAEARLQGVHVVCVTIDRKGPTYLPRMFGPSGYTVLWNVSQLPERLPQIYRRLTAAA